MAAVRLSFSFALVVLLVRLHLGSGQISSCIQCRGGLSTACAIDAPSNAGACEFKNSSCYEAVINYQNGAFPLVQRNCYVPQKPESTFCNTFKSDVGFLIKCRDCFDNNCNSQNYYALFPNRISPRRLF